MSDSDGNMTDTTQPYSPNDNMTDTTQPYSPNDNSDNNDNAHVHPQAEANNENDSCYYVVVSNRRHPPTVVFQSIERASLRREVHGVHHQATQEVARLQRIITRLAVHIDTLRVETEGPLMDLDSEYNGLAGLMNGLQEYHDMLCHQVEFYTYQHQMAAYLIEEHFPSFPWQGYI